MKKIFTAARRYYYPVLCGALLTWDSFPARIIGVLGVIVMFGEILYRRDPE